MARYDIKSPDANDIEVLDEEGNVVDGVYLVDTEEEYLIRYGGPPMDGNLRVECPEMPGYVALKMYMVYGKFTTRNKAPSANG